MRLQNGLPLYVLLFFLGFRQIISTTLSISDDHGECGFSNDEEDLCALYCHRSMKLGLAYIIELKEKIKMLEENHSESENSQLTKAVENLQSKIDQQNIQIANINDFITNSVYKQNQVEEKAKSQTEIDNFKRKVEQLKEKLKNVELQAAKDKEKSLAEQKNLRNKIEQILRDKSKELDGARNREIENLKEELATQKSDLDKAIKDLESKNKEFVEYQTKEKNSSNKIGELNSKISSLKKTLEESETKLTDSNHLLKKNSLQLNQTNEYLIECQKIIPTTGCKGLSSGIHQIGFPGIDPISALCEGDLDGGGWIVIHKRFDGSVDFNRTWTEYRNGFGNKEGEFFIGHENLHRITNSQTYELYVQLGYHSKPFQSASYGNFRIGNETTKYKLVSLGEYTGTALDIMNDHLNQAFSSVDQDNDRWKFGNCAKYYGAWWHGNCSRIYLSGKYFNKEVKNYLSMRWNNDSLKSVQMLIRPKFRWTSSQN